MEETMDMYSDQFQVSIGPFGCALDFSVSPATPPAPGKPPEVKRIATIRMSNEHLKVMAFMLRKQIMKVERDTGIQVQLPVEFLNKMGISPSDWDAIWNQP